jgi:hypothetical protein
VAMLAGLVFVAMTAAILTVSAASRRRSSTAAETQKSFVGFGDSDSISEEALTGHAGLSARGGVEDDALWGDDPMESEEDAMNANEAQIEPSPVQPDSMEPEQPPEAESGALAMDNDPSSVTDAPPTTTTGDSVQEGNERASAPPVPESGLPEGWTMEQWEHYGHQWLAKQAED